MLSVCMYIRALAQTKKIELIGIYLKSYLCGRRALPVGSQPIELAILEQNRHPPIRNTQIHTFFINFEKSYSYNHAFIGLP